MKKLLSIILALTLVILSVPSMAEEVTEGSDFDPTVYDYISVATFNDGTPNSIASSNTWLSPKAYGDANGSVLYSLDAPNKLVCKLDESLGSIKNKFPQPADGVVTGRENAVIKLRFYSEDVGSKFILHFRNSSGNIKNPNAFEIEIKNFGWQEYSFLFYKAIQGVGDTNVHNLTHLEISAPEGGSKGTIYLDKAWFERVPIASDANITQVDETDKILVLDALKARSADDTTKTDVVSGYTTNLRPNGASSFSMVTINEANPKFKYELTCGGEKVSADYADYKYLNMWLYSPRPQSGGLGVHFNKTTTGKRGIPLSFDWAGWKLVSVKLDSRLTDGNKGPINSVQIVLGDINSHSNNVYKWDYDTNSFSKTVKAINDFDTPWNEWNNSGSFGIESAWFSANSPLDANVRPGSTTFKEETPIMPADGDWVVYDIASKQGVDKDGAQYDTNFSRAYAAAWKSMPGSAGDPIGQIKITPTWGEDSKISSIKIQRSIVDDWNGLYGTGYYDITTPGYKYVNLWIYSPGVRLDQFGNHSEYVLCLNLYTKTRENNNTANKRIGVGIPANWTGWKLVSIPLDGLSKQHQGYLEYGVRRIELLGNNTNFANDLLTSNKNEIVITDAAEIAKFSPDCGDDDPKTNISRNVDGLEYDFGLTEAGEYHGDFNTFCEYDSYAVVERLWFSKEAPSSEFATFETQEKSGAQLIGDKEFELTSSIANIGLIKGQTLTGATGEFSVPYDGPTALGQKKIIVLPEIYNTSGYLFEGRTSHSVTTPDYHYSAVDKENRKVTVDLSEAYVEKYADLNLICAGYYGSDKSELADVILVPYSADNSITVEYDNLKGDYMQVMLWDMATLEPITEVIPLQ